MNELNHIDEMNQMDQMNEINEIDENLSDYIFQSLSQSAKKPRN